MDELQIVRGTLLRAAKSACASSPMGKALLDWASRHQAWLRIGERENRWEALLQAAKQHGPTEEAPPFAVHIAQRLAATLAFDDFDTRLLSIAVACARLARLSELIDAISRERGDLPGLIGELAGAKAQDACRRVQRSMVVRLGLITFRTRHNGAVEIDVGRALERLIERRIDGEHDLVAALVGPRQPARIKLDDFAYQEEARYLVRLLHGAGASKAEGVNILIHGPPGAGKTELARTLAAAVDAKLYGVGEADEDGDEPERYERIQALHLAQRLLGRSHDSILLFDEMEDLIGDARPSLGDWWSARSGSKVFVNRLLESNPVPVIWTTNAIGNIDKAILRRMSFVLKMGVPSRAQGRRMLARIAAEEGVQPTTAFARLVDAAPETATVLRVAARAGKLADDADGGVLPATMLVRAISGQNPLPVCDDAIDLDLFETDLHLEHLMSRIVALEDLDVSLLLTGPPGTGKTALAHHLARLLDFPLIVKRASDLLSPWVGGTEAAIAEAFVEAREQRAVLLFDEADSLLFDRSTARASWEVGQVNELLTWLDRHPLPIVAATNFPQKLDPAALRRFVFKLDFQPLGQARASRAFETFFGLPAPASLAELTGLTPGDFVTVKRQMRYKALSAPESILEALRVEVDAKPSMPARIGF